MTITIEKTLNSLVGAPQHTGQECPHNVSGVGAAFHHLLPHSVQQELHHAPLGDAAVAKLPPADSLFHF